MALKLFPVMQNLMLWMLSWRPRVSGRKWVEIWE
jgi:hypothetical protein